MPISRRTLALAAAGAVAATVAMPSLPAAAQAADEAALTAAIESLRVAILAVDKAKLEGLLADTLSYGHSDGRLEDKAQFIGSRTAATKSLAFSEHKNAVHGNTAIARHIWASESMTDGKASSARVGVLQVWQKQDGKWKLYARQAHSLPK